MNLINCPECGKRISDQNKFCPECGCDLTIFASAGKTKPQKNKRFPKILIILLLVLLCAALFVGLLRKKSAAPSPAAEPSAQETVAPQIEKPSAQEERPTENSPENTAEPSLLSGESQTSQAAQEPEDLPSQAVQNPAEPTSQTGQNPTESADAQAPENALPIGVYAGDDADILVIAENGKAAYYCTDFSYTELDCPWSADDGVLRIEFSKLHCSVSAKLTGNDFSTLILDSDSINWNAEVFHRLDLQPEDYLSRSVSSCDPAVRVQSDGTMVFALDGLSFRIPKHYIDLPDSFDQDANHFSFVDIDAQEDYEGALMISRMSAQNASADILAAAYSGNFLENVQVSFMNTLKIADRKATEFALSGIYNSNFRTSGGCAAEGKLTVIDGAQPGTYLFVLWVQIQDRPTDNSSEYANILSAIR